jgi:flagellar basal-body rod modification protein FlgD
MTDLVSFIPASQSGSTSGAVSATATLADNFDTFLHILTAQIQNQDPLEPMDSSQFTQQLVQFSGVEQQIRANQQLETLISATRSNAGAALSGYLGAEAELSSAGAHYRGDPIKWRYALPKDAATATITVTNQKGNVVYAKTAAAGELTAGSHDFAWDGELNGGGAAGDDEVYYINVVATDANGATVTPSHTLRAVITGVDLTFDEPAFTTTVGIFSYSQVVRLNKV